MYMPIQFTDLIANVSGRRKTGDRAKVGCSRSSTKDRRDSLTNSELSYTPTPSHHVSSLVSTAMVGELREATVGFVKFDTTSLMDLNIKNSKVKEVRGGGYLSVAWSPNTKVRCTPQNEMTELQNIVSECVDAADAVLSHGGLVNKFLMDDKGLSMLFAYGTPGFSYEGNSFKALWAALDIRMRIGQLRKNGFGIGIASGHICVSVLGVQSIRCEYALAGSSINLASRLAEHSLKLGKGSVLTEPRTIGLKEADLADGSRPEGIALKPGITVCNVGRLKLKGNSGTTRIYSAKREQLKINVNWKAQNIWMGRMPQRSSRGPIGREKEFQVLRECLSLNDLQPKDEMSCCLIVEGERGMGKSHLLNHALSLCGGADPDIVRTRLQEPGIKGGSFTGVEMPINSDVGSSGNTSQRRFVSY